MPGIRTGVFYGRGVPKSYTGFAVLADGNYSIVQPPVLQRGNTAPAGYVGGASLPDIVSSSQYLSFRLRGR